MKKPKKLTEGDIQEFLYHRFNSSLYTLAIPSTAVMGWEADLIIVTRALVTHEFEIKISRSDFRADKKKGKWFHFEKWKAGEREYPARDRFGKELWGASWMLPVFKPPNYFWYVSPPGIIPIDEVPDFAGLIFPERDPKKWTQFTIAKKAPRLCAEKLSEKQILQLCRSMTFKYWNQRLGQAQPLTIIP